MSVCASEMRRVISSLGEAGPALANPFGTAAMLSWTTIAPPLRGFPTTPARPGTAARERKGFKRIVVSNRMVWVVSLAWHLALRILNKPRYSPFRQLNHV